MATIAITAPNTAPSTRLRLTARGRRVLTFLAALPVVIAVAIAIISGGSALATNEQAAPTGSFVEITVMPGESLWSIAESVAPNADPRDVVAAITRLNVLEGGGLSAGQRIAIPAEYATAS